MNKTDKETLLDLHTTIADMIKEVKDLLKLEATSETYDRALVWLSEMEDSLGGGSYVDAYAPSFWQTLEELGILNMDGSVAKLDDDDDDGLDDDDIATATEIECSRCLCRYPAGTSKCATANCGKDLSEEGATDMESEGCPNTSSRPLVPNGKPIIEHDGSTRWLNQYGLLHRNDGGPALEGKDGLREWWENGQKHRIGGPAVVYPGGDTVWYFRGQYHREDGPAIDFKNGHQVWYRYGLKIESPKDNENTKKSRDLWAEGWERTFGNGNKRVGYSNYLSGSSGLYKPLLTLPPTKENNNEDEDFVEDTYTLDESQIKGEGDQNQDATMDQQTTVELREVASKVPEQTPPAIFGPYACWFGGED